MTSRKYHRHFQDRIEDRDPTKMWMELGDGYVVRNDDKYVAVDDMFIVYRNAEVLFQTEMIKLGQKVDRGQIVEEVAPSWMALHKEILEDPSLLSKFPAYHRKFEEFIAGGYLAEHWKDVILSPRSHDLGFDVAAWNRHGQILDDMKARKSSLRVKHLDVRAILGLFFQHRKIDQVRITTTSTFAPLVEADFSDAISSGKLLLRDKSTLLKWLASLEVKVVK